eukprot:CAMPEP_0198491678 /NCGR_PEP_ID=MMETSP1462-20131121/2938_1 /TAXON_ID=1333877 /ORGANISM="Brandtodinium nutriculum, Strain RCC3387" /LENGTH=214 /DNA_ID=CAMNT_0044220293 /DNA_START=196 /DNA_END=840 /DNA_ORIENTATION=+
MVRAAIMSVMSEVHSAFWLTEVAQSETVDAMKPAVQPKDEITYNMSMEHDSHSPLGHAFTAPFMKSAAAKEPMLACIGLITQKPKFVLACWPSWAAHAFRNNVLRWSCLQSMPTALDASPKSMSAAIMAVTSAAQVDPGNAVAVGPHCEHMAEMKNAVQPRPAKMPMMSTAQVFAASMCRRGPTSATPPAFLTWGQFTAALLMARAPSMRYSVA